MEPVVAPRTFSGRYEVTHLIARGGMAQVYRALDTRLGRHVALKVLFPELSVDRTFVERFRREAQAAANLSHPNIVAVYDWGEDEGTYFIVMELITGTSLATALRAETTLPATRAATIAAAGRRAPSPTRTATASCTATSSRATCCSPTTARSRSPTSGSPRR